MAVDHETHADVRTSSPVLVSRQPVVDLWDRVTGYRISYALLEDGAPVPPAADQALLVIEEVLGVIGHEEQAAGSTAHLPVTREMLLGGGVPPVDPKQVLLRVRYADLSSGPVLRTLGRAVERGYSLQLGGMPGPSFDVSRLELFKSVELDVSSWSLDDVSAALPKIRAQGCLAHATGVQTHADREQARSLGFEWFSGPFFATPNLLAGSPIPIGDMRTLVELTRMQGGEVELEDLVTLIEQDVGLGVRLLRYINSAYFGLSGQVRSIRHAVTMLGSRGVSRWALVAATIGGGEQIPRELALLALTRARACELLAAEYGILKPDEMFTIGMLSALDAVFRMPIETVLDELPLAEEARAALLRREGPAGKILAAVIAYEDGEFLAPSVRPSLVANAEAYRTGLGWAREAVAGLAA